MPTAWPGRAPPYEVAAGYHPFVDYRYVHAGQARWLHADGREPAASTGTMARYRRVDRADTLRW